MNPIPIQVGTVKHARVMQCGKHVAIATVYDSGAQIRLHWSHLRRIESGAKNEPLFTEGEFRKVHEGDEVIFVPTSDWCFWYWGLQSEYQSIVVDAPEPLRCEQSPPTVIDPEEELLELARGACGKRAGTATIHSWATA
jgi:hypothetical protein